MIHEKTISDLAYHLWRARGCPEGSSQTDWAEAERQVRGTLSGSDGRAPETPPSEGKAAKVQGVSPAPAGEPAAGDPTAYALGAGGSLAGDPSTGEPAADALGAVGSLAGNPAISDPAPGASTPGASDSVASPEKPGAAVTPVISAKKRTKRRS